MKDRLIALIEGTCARLHDLRCWVWRHVWSGFLTQEACEERCVDCGRVLTEQEEEAYGCVCETCEGVWFAKTERHL